jgi:hypothetical protein
VDEVVMTSWDGAHSIAADDLRDLLRGRVVTDPDPRGLRLRAARIRGRLDLDNLNTTVKLTLLDCLLDEGITAEAAHLPGLSLRRCLLTHPSKPALYADELRTDAGVSLEEPARLLALHPVDLASPDRAVAGLQPVTNPPPSSPSLRPGHGVVAHREVDGMKHPHPGRPARPVRAALDLPRRST